jgi:hypothetical protein
MPCDTVRERGEGDLHKAVSAGLVQCIRGNDVCSYPLALDRTQRGLAWI